MIWLLGNHSAERIKINTQYGIRQSQGAWRRLPAMCCGQVLVLFMNKINLELDHTSYTWCKSTCAQRKTPVSRPNYYAPLEQSRDQSVSLKWLVCFHSLNESFVNEIPMVLVVNPRDWLACWEKGSYQGHISRQIDWIVPEKLKFLADTFHFYCATGVNIVSSVVNRAQPSAIFPLLTPVTHNSALKVTIKDCAIRLVCPFSIVLMLYK